jgi:hypothetical protein
MLVADLKVLCRARGLRFGGAKAILVARLEESDRTLAGDEPGCVVV